MIVNTITPRCYACRLPVKRGVQGEHKFSCGKVKTWYFGGDLPKRDPGRSIRRPWLAKWPKPRKQEKKVKTTTWHVIPSRGVTHVTDHIHIFNDSDVSAHVELTPSGELHVKKLTSGRLIIGYTDPDGE